MAKGLPPVPPNWLPPDPRILTTPSPDDDNLHFDLIEAATNGMAERQAITKHEYRSLDEDAQRQAFTVADVATEETVKRIQEALVEDIAGGGTLREFKKKVQEALDTSWLSPSQVENTYRTAVGTEYSNAKNEMHQRVKSDFPFVLDASIGDSRRSPLCETMSRSGIQGTNIYLYDDPEWQRLRPTRHWQCRCDAVALSVEDAARRGIVYAQLWLELGRQPPNPPFVGLIGAELPKGWIR